MGESSGTTVGGSFSAARSEALSWLVLAPSLRLLLMSARTRCASCCMNSQASPALVPGNHSWTTWMAWTAKGKSGAIASVCLLVVGRCEYGGGVPSDRWREAMLLFYWRGRRKQWREGGRE